MKKIYSFLFAIITFATFLPVRADVVPEAEAKAVAARFFVSDAGARKGRSVREVSRMKLSHSYMTENNIPSVYVYTIPGEYVVVSATTLSSDPVLAYGTGDFSYEEAPAPMKWWLDEYGRQIAAAEADGAESAAADSSAYEGLPSSVEPLLGGIAWDQLSPFNDKCPVIKGKRSPSGCVATATAQVMRYYRYPAAGKGSWQYQWVYESLDTVLQADFSKSVYNWDLMPMRYGASSTEAERKEVAKLMSDVGIASTMDYGEQESGALSMSTVFALVDNFGYDMGVRYHDRSAYGVALWERMIRGELAAGRPVIYAGQSGSGGHQFVCDGYDADGYFHFNWGWSGFCNGYFRLSALIPDGAGTGGYIDGYNFNQVAITGIQPAVEGHDVSYGQSFYGQEFYSTDGTSYKYRTGGINFHRADASIDFGLMVTGSPEPMVDSTYVKSLYTLKFQPRACKRSSGAMYITYLMNKTFNFDPAQNFELPDGTYYVYPVAKPTKSESWEITPMGSMQNVCINVKDGVTTLVNTGNVGMTIDDVEVPENLPVGRPTAVKGLISAQNGDVTTRLGLILKTLSGDTIGVAPTQLVEIPANSTISFSLPLTVPPDVKSGVAKAQLLVLGQEYGSEFNINIVSQAVELSKKNFADEALIAVLNPFDKDTDGWLSDTELYGITSLNASGAGIGDATGLEYIYNLRRLNVSNNAIGAVDLTSMPWLTELDVSGNALETLDVSKNSRLSTLRCSANGLTSLNLENQSMLETLDVAGNPMISLELSRNEALADFAAGSGLHIALDEDGSFDLAVSDGFKADRVHDLDGATISGSKLTVSPGANRVTYNYDTGNPGVPYLPVQLSFARVTGVDTVSADATPGIYCEGLTLVNPAGEMITVCTADGRQIYSGHDTAVDMPEAGVYIVSTQGGAVKVMAGR